MGPFMPDTDTSKTTTDHSKIREWAESRGGKPAAVESTDDKDDTGIIRLMFPDDSNSESDNLTEISWDTWFEKFEESDLALLYQDETADGDKSKFNKLVSR